MNNALDLHPKVAGGSLASAVGIVLVWALGLAHVTVDPVVAGAMVLTLGGLGGYLAPLVHKETAATSGPGA